MTYSELTRLFREMDELRREQRAAKTPQLAASSVENGSIDVNDATGSTTAILGLQYDGTWTAASVAGPPPPQPSGPVVAGVAGGLTVRWDGTFAGAGTVAPMDWARTDVTVGPVGMDPIGTPPMVSITSPRGGEVFVPVQPGQYQVVLVARSLSGRASEPSLPASATALPLVDAGEFQAARADLDAARARLTAAEQAVDANETEIAAAKARLVKAEQDATKALTDALAAAQSATTANSVATQAKDTADTVAQSGTNLVVNGSGIRGVNTNFTSFTFNGADAPAGASGSFVAKTTGAQALLTDSPVPWVPGRSYVLSFQARQTVAGATNRAYGGIAPYDAAGLPIGPQTYAYIAGTTTTLAADLKPGDTTVKLADARNWYGQSGKAAGSSTHLRGIIAWNYVDKFGRAWAPGTYSRNVWFGLWADGGIDASTNTITLTAPWPASNGTLTAGTVVSNSTSGGSYRYMPSLGNVVVPETWTAYADTLTVGVMPAAQQAVAMNVPFGWSHGLPEATAFIRPAWLLNYAASPANSVVGRHAIAAVSFSDVSAAQAMAGTAQTAADAANVLAAQAKTVADSKVTIFRQSAAPTGGTYKANGDLWLDSDDGLVYVATSTTGGWVLHSDQRIAAVVTSNAAKTTVFAQASPPTTSGRTVGDLWIDTDDGNRLYDWSGSAWTARLMGASAISATARDLGAVTIFRQSTAPAGALVSGDLWIDADDGLVYVWTGSWTLSADQRIGLLVTSNAAKIALFAQASPPSTTGRTVGDLWIDTDDGNRLYDWTVSGWTARLLGDSALASLDLSKLVVTGATNLNTVVAQQIAADTAAFQTVDIANLTVTDTSVMSEVVAQRIGAEVGEFVTVRANNLEAVMALVTTLTSGGEGRRWEADVDGIRVFEADGSILINFPTDADSPAQFEGTILAESLTVKNRFALRGIDNEVSKGAKLALSGGTTAPTSGPSVAVSYPEYAPSGRWSYLFVPAGHHANIDDTNDITAVTSFFGYGQMFGPGGRRYNFPEVTDADGNKRSTYGNFGNSAMVWTTGERVVAQSVRCLTNGAQPDGSIDVWDPSTMTSSGTAAPALTCHLNSVLDTYYYETKLGRVFSPAGSTQYRERFSMAIRRQQYGDILLRQYYMTNDTTMGYTGNELKITDPLIKDEILAGVTHGYTDALGYPTGSGHLYVWLVHGSVNTYAYSTSGQRLPEYDFPSPPGTARMSAWGSVEQNTCIGFRATRWEDKTPVIKLTGNHWLGSTSPKWWSSLTWYDPDPTVEAAPGGGTHETAQSPRAAVTMRKRAGLTVTIPPYPERPFPTTTDDVLSARIYLGRGASDPGRVAMERVTQLDSPTRVTSIGTFAFPAGSAAAPPPATSDFPASSPGQITSADGTSIVIAGDGSFTLGPISRAATGVVTIAGEGWVAPALGNGWANLGGGDHIAGYRRLLNGTVELRGVIRSGNSNTAIFTLPVGYRPAAREIFTSWGGSGVARVDVNSSGAVLVNGYAAGGSNAAVSLSGVRFDTRA